MSTKKSDLEMVHFPGTTDALDALSIYAETTPKTGNVISVMASHPIFGDIVFESHKNTSEYDSGSLNLEVVDFKVTLIDGTEKSFQKLMTTDEYLKFVNSAQPNNHE